MLESERNLLAFLNYLMKLTKIIKVMKITEIQIEFIKPNNGLIGFASLVIDCNIYLSSIAIHKKLNSANYRLTYPSKENLTYFIL